MAYSPNNINGQATMANSAPVVIASDQTLIPINASQVGGASFGLGQQLAAASLPVVLTAAQLSTLTPLSTIAATQSGTWNIGTLTTLTGITNAVTVAQATAASLNATVVGTGTFVTQSTLAAETTKVIGTVRTSDGAGNLYTSNSTTYTAKFAQDGNLLGTLGTAFSTAGKVDVKAADGDVFVRQATASNLNATVVGTGTFATQATLTAETTKVIGTVRTLGNAGATLDSTVGAGTAPTNQLVVGALYNSTEISPTTGQAFALQADSKGRQRMVIMDGAGNTRAQNVTASNAALVDLSASAANSTAGLLSVKLDQTTPGTTNAVSLAQIAGTTVVTGGLAGVLAVGGNVATNVALTANPINIAVQGVSSENAAVTTSRLCQLVSDLYGKLIISPYAGRDNFVKGNATATGTTSTSCVAAAGASLKNYITNIFVFNTGATTVEINIQDGSGGTTLYQVGAPAGGGASVQLPVPISGTANTAVFFAASGSTTTLYVSMSGYKGA